MALTWELPEEILLDATLEADRLDSLRSLDLDSNAEDRFDRVTRLAADFFEVPMAYVAFIEEDRQWYKSAVGMPLAETSRSISLCQYTIQRNQPLVIPDTLLNPLSRTHPMVMADPKLRFYAGIPLKGPRGQNVGTFCLLDLKPREFDEDHLARLISFGSIVEREINLASVIKTQHELLSARQQLGEVQTRLRREFDDAAKYVRLMLPPPLAGREMIDWQFQPSTHLGGDGLGYRRINADQIAFYVLDVTGHGLGSALLAVTALELLRTRAARDIDFSRPAAVLERLNRTFQMKDHAGKFFSVWYGVYSRSARQITYASAGHPPALLLTEKEGKTTLTKSPAVGAVLGVLPESDSKEDVLDFPPGSQLCVFTDGLYETIDEQKDHGSYDQFYDYLQSQVAIGEPLYQSILQWLERAREQHFIDDDVTLLRFMTKD